MRSPVTLGSAFTPLPRQRLSDEVVRRITGSIESGRYRDGDRLPPTTEMARRFNVARCTVREALTTLELMQVIEIRPGSGVYVRRLP